MDPLMPALRKAQIRLGLQLWLRYNVTALTIAFSLWCVWLLLTRLFPLLNVGAFPYLLVICLALAASTLCAVFRRPTVLNAALESDARLGLQERLTSSLQLATAEGPMIQALHEDARAHLAVLDITDAFPITPPPSARWVAIPLVLFAFGYLAMPDLDLFGFKERQLQQEKKKEARKIQAERLRAIALPLEKTEQPQSERSTTDATDLINRVAEQIQAGELTEKQMLAKLNNLAEEIDKHRESMQQASAVPKLENSANQLNATKDLAQSLAKGDFAAAAQKAKELQEKLAKGDMGAEEKKALAQELSKLSEMLKDGQQDSALSEALAKLAAKLGAENTSADAPGSMDKNAANEDLSMEDVASILEQMDKLSEAMEKLDKIQTEMLGPSEFCRSCGQKLKKCPNGKGCKACGAGSSCFGRCAACAGKFGKGRWAKGHSDKFGPGMGGPGRGRGSSTGPLPDVEDSFSPTMLPGESTQGKFLASIVQRTNPDDDNVEPTRQFVTETLTSAKQEAEQALTKEEIPAGSREFVRQYFSSFEQTQESGSGDGSSAPPPPAVASTPAP